MSVYLKWGIALARDHPLVIGDIISRPAVNQPAIASDEPMRAQKPNVPDRPVRKFGTPDRKSPTCAEIRETMISGA